MDSNITTMRIAKRLAQCEQSADRLMAETASLLAELATARAAHDAFGTGQRAISRVIEAQRAMAEVQASLLRAHLDLAKVGQERGHLIDGDCPDPKALVPAAAA